MNEPLATLLSITIVLPAMMIGFFAALFGLSRILAPDRLRIAFADLRSWRINIRQVMVIIAVAALVLSLPASRSEFQVILTIVVLCLWVLTWFIRSWLREFIFLMGLRDGDFPGRHDKVIWVLVLLPFPPIGFWLFRAYRLAHWPEPAPAIDGGGRVQEARSTATQPA